MYTINHNEVHLIKRLFFFLRTAQWLEFDPEPKTPSVPSFACYPHVRTGLNWVQGSFK